MGSPLKRATGTPMSHSKANRLLHDGVDTEQGDGDDNDEEEDEEMLQLKLAAIEARMKLKQLQKSRGRADDETDVSSPRPTSARLLDPPSFSRPRRQSSPPPPAKRNKMPESDDIQVPVSPSKRPSITAFEPASPRRVVLGIDKGLKGSDVSLKRPPSTAKTASARPTSRLAGRDGAGSRNGDVFGSRPQSSATNDDDMRPKKSFSERIAETRSVEKTRQERSERAERINAGRSSGFQLDKSEMEAFSAAAEARANAPPSPTRSRPAESFSREDILRSYNGLNGPALKRNSTTTSGTPRGSGPYLHRRSNTLDLGSNSLTSTSTSQPENGAVEKAADFSKYEGYSATHLSNRVLPHSFLSRALVGKKVLRIPDLLKTVKAPDFELPEDVDGDYVVFGIVASKSEPRQVKETKRVTKQAADPFDDGLNNTDKYMVMTLTDLKWTVDLLLFNTAFPRYYRLTEGMLVGILNPTIMPPPKGKADTNRFSLSLSSADDKVLEVGFAQDIGFCKAVRKDGKTCQAWVDGRKTEFCDFHVDLQVRRTQSGRMGINNGPGMLGPGGQSGSRTGFYGGSGKRPNKNQTGLKPENGRYDAGSQSVYYVAPGLKSRGGGGGGGGNGSAGYNPFLSGQSASRLLDAEEEDPFIAAGMMGRGMENKEERTRRKLAEQQRERDITKKLITAGGGGGVGAEYLRAHTGNASTKSDAKSEENVKPGEVVANALGLNGLRKADAVKLSPLKRGFDKPHDSGVKKTRFITAKGIKEAGRESLGGPSSEALAQARTGNSAAAADDDDDDDELDII